jgi:hypothetical protein
MATQTLEYDEISTEEYNGSLNMKNIWTVTKSLLLTELLSKVQSGSVHCGMALQRPMGQVCIVNDAIRRNQPSLTM